MSGRWAFTPAQYEELEQQALIYKYLLAGVPVPPDLLLPIRRGFGVPTNAWQPSRPFVYHQPARKHTRAMP
jgi:hypothetical protein